VEGTDHPLPPPIPLPHPPAAVDASYALEPWEGMRVMLASPALVVNPTYSSCGFTVWPYQQAPARMFRREMTDPGGPLLGVLHETDLNCGTFPDVKTGDRVEGISGPLLYHFEEFKVVQQEAAALGVTAVPLPPLPEPPALSQNQFSLATFNMENHFDGVDDTGDPAEPKPSAAAIAVKQAKLAAAISEILGCPTLIGVQEVEKELLLAELAALAADACGFNYAVTHLDSPDARGIDVALLSDPRRVVITAAELRQGCTPLETNTVDPEVFCPAGEDPLFSRPPLLVRLTVDGQPLAVIVNHFKSKRGGELATAARREAQAAHVRRLTQEILADDPDAWVVVLGDFNDYERSPALAQLQLGLVDLLARIPADSRYTFLFSGRAQLIDGMLASPALAAAVEGVRIQHVNADYPAAWGAVVDGRKLLYRATDHDLPLAVINLPDSADGEMKPVPAEATAAVPPTAVTDDAATPRRWLVFLIPASGAGLIIWWSRRRKKRTHVDA